MPAPFDEQPTCATSTTTTPHPYPLASSLSAPRLNQQTLDQSNHPSIHPPERFMQPEPSTESPTKSKEHTQQEETPTTTQHGLYERDQPGDAPHQSDVAATDAHSGLTRDEQLAADAAFAASLQEERRSSPERRVETGRMSDKNKPSPPSRNRIAEYEEASTPPIQRREPPGFEVIKKPRNPEDKRSAIQEMPNEVLVHALAHLAPNDLTSVALVSKRFHDLVTGPYAWRSAFAHFFPGPDSIDALFQDDSSATQDIVRTERRAFTRLTALASWRSEYIMRTRLLRSLTRGKPVQAIAAPSAARAGQGHTAVPIITYNSQLFGTVNYLHATFGNGINKRTPRFIHGADELGTATSSDPSAAKVDHWGLSDPRTFSQFSDINPGDTQYGLGPGEVIGAPNVMDVSQPYGMVLGEGVPDGMLYYRPTDEMIGRFNQLSSAMSAPEIGIPKLVPINESLTAIWIAKSSNIPAVTDGLVGIVSGSSAGVLTACSLGSAGAGSHRDQRFGRGEMTARWVLSPGVPLIAIAIDNEYNMQRYAQNRIWAVVLNALGEVFYLTKFPKRPHVERGARLDSEAIETNAWTTGRSVYWNVVEPSRRTAKPDPYASSAVDGSYSPRSSWNGMCLSKDQIRAETREIESFLAYRPRDFRKLCFGWDMRRKMEVDFAGDDGHNAGENIIVIDCGLEEENVPGIKRYSRSRFQERHSQDASPTPPLTTGSTQPSGSPSLFGGTPPPSTAPTSSFSFDSLEDSLSHDDFGGSITPRPMTEEWRTTNFAFGGLKNTQILVSIIDISLYAIQTTSEDTLLSFSGRSTTSSPSLTPMSPTDPPANSGDIPGQRARLFAIGTKTGSILLWNARAPVPRSGETTNTIDPVRIIYTESPQISCLGLSSLYLVHGGNDGLVQAWDPLGSSMQPIRTLNSRFSSRARRRLVQAQASPQGVGINLFAAGAICLDPDPTVLRGMVSLGTHLRYWAYSSSAADQYKSSKRRLRRSERSSNNGGERFSGATRSNLKHYIANEQFELDKEKQEKRKDAQRFAGRFGTELLDGSEEEMLAYAAMLSQESLKHEKRRRTSNDSTAVSSADASTRATGNVTPTVSPSPPRSTPKTEDELDADMTEAIRQSLAPSPPGGGHDIPIRHAKPKQRKASSARASPAFQPAEAGSSRVDEMDDLEFAMQLSLAEEQSKAAAAEAVSEEYPVLSPGAEGSGKGKGRM